MAVLPLSFIAQEVCTKALLGHINEATASVSLYVQRLFNTDKYTAVSEQILKRIVDLYPKNLTNELLVCLTPPHVKELVLSDCTSVGVQGIINVCKKCIRLVSLDLTRCDQLMAPCLFKLLGRIAKTITSLSLEECTKITDVTVQTILRHMQNLKSLSLSSCVGITDDVFLLDTDSQLGIDTDKKSAMPVFNPNLRCAHLTSLDVSGCQSITSKAIRHLTTLCGPSLRHVDISWTKIDILALWYLAGYNLSSAIDLAMLVHIKDLHGNHEEILEQIKHFNLAKSPQSDAEATEKSQTEKNWAPAEVFVPEKTVQNYDVGEADRFDGENIGTYMYEVEGVTNSKTTEFNCLRDLANETGEVDSGKDSCALHWNDVSAAVGGWSDEGRPRGGISSVNTVVNTEFDDSDAESLPKPAEVSNCDVNLDGAKPKLLVNNYTSLPLGGACKIVSKSESVRPIEKINMAATSFGSLAADCDERDWTNESALKRDGKVIELESTNENVESESKCEEVRDNNGQGWSRAVGQNIEAEGKLPLTDALEVDEQANCDIEVLSFENKDVVSSKSVEFPVISARKDSSNREVKSCDNLLENQEKSPDSLLVDVPGASPGVPGVGSAELGQNVGSENKEISEPEKSDGRTLQEDELLDQDGRFKRDSTSGSLLSGDECAIASIGRKQKIPQEVIQFYKPDIAVIKINFMEKPWSYELGAACMKAFFSKNCHVTQICITWKGMNDELLEFIAERVPDVTHVKLTDCESLSLHGLVKMAQHCKKIQHLDLKGVCFIGDAAVTPIIANRSLQSISLAECNITDLTLRMLSVHCQEKLQTLDLSWCENLTIDAINRVARTCTLLKTLELRQCAVTDTTLDLLGNHCPLLEKLNLSNVDISDDGVVRLVRRLPLLKHLDISWNQALTDDSVDAIFTNCPLMYDLCLVGLKRLTSKPFLPIIANFDQWQRCQALLRLKQRERELFDSDEHFSSDEARLLPDMQCLIFPVARDNLKSARTTWLLSTACPVDDLPKEFDDLYIPHRSTSYSPNLTKLNLDYCDRINDTYLGNIVAVCRGSLAITDYYGCSVAAIWATAKPEMLE